MWLIMYYTCQHNMRVFDKFNNLHIIETYFYEKKKYIEKYKNSNFM